MKALSLESTKKMQDLQARFAGLRKLETQTQADYKANDQSLQKIESYLSIANRVSDALESLSDQLFRDSLREIERELTVALQEVLEQPIKLVAEASWKNNAAAVDFFVERDGFKEDILKGQGGSVANILSIGLRIFALAKLESKQNQMFLVFDEQDCWLRPDLVPRLVRLVHKACHELGIQVLMISHHDRDIFEQYADKIYQLTPGMNGVANVECVFERDSFNG